MRELRSTIVGPLGAVALMAMVFVAYIPVRHAGFIWDDDQYVRQNPTLRSVDGLRRIWFEIGATPQYYPLVFTTFWVEHHFWQDHPLGYHIVNVLLHGLAAVVLWRILRRLAVPGAWLAAAIFAVHPVCVESVAWITERKNVLSGLMALLALRFYLHFDPLGDVASGPRAGRRHWWAFTAATLCFAAALTSKTVTCVLPAVVLLIYWWKRGRIRLADVLPLVVWCAMAVPMGLLTAHLERVQVGAVGEDWSFTFVDRCLIAGRVVWFYVGKLLWPHPLIFFYRRWSVDAAAAWQYLFPAGVLVAIAVLWLLRRRIGRGPLVAWLIFLGALFPASGFFDVFPMRYSFVADHFQYHACMALIALFAVTLTTVLRRVVPVPRARRVASVIGTSLLLAVLGALTWRRCATYENLESLWRDTIAKNPTAWAAYNNLGNVLRHRHRPHEAVGLFERSLELRPRQIEAPINLASTLIELGHLGAALPYARQAYELAPRYALANYQLGYTLGRLNRPAEAIPYLQKAIATQPDRADWRSDYGNVLLQAGRIEEAVAQYKKALELDPDLTAAMINLGHALTRLHRYDEAIAVLQRAVALDPDNPTAKKNLESARQANAQSPQ